MPVTKINGEYYGLFGVYPSRDDAEYVKNRVILEYGCPATVRPVKPPAIINLSEVYAVYVRRSSDIYIPAYDSTHNNRPLCMKQDFGKGEFAAMKAWTDLDNMFVGVSIYQKLGFGTFSETYTLDADERRKLMLYLAVAEAVLDGSAEKLWGEP